MPNIRIAQILSYKFFISDERPHVWVWNAREESKIQLVLHERRGRGGLLVNYWVITEAGTGPGLANAHHRHVGELNADTINLAMSQAGITGPYKELIKETLVYIAGSIQKYIADNGRVGADMGAIYTFTRSFAHPDNNALAERNPPVTTAF